MIIDSLEKQAYRRPEKTALVDPAGSEYSYKEFRYRVKKGAERLRDSGIGPGNHVGLLVRDRFLYVLLLYSLREAGATVVPLSKDVRAAELEQLIRLADISHLMFSEEDSSRVISLSETDYLHLRGSGSILLETLRTDSNHKDKSGESKPEFILFTSGSTGIPAPVMLNSKQLFYSACSSAFRLGCFPDDVWVDPLPLNHLGGISPLFRSFLFGATVVLTSTDPVNISKALVRYEATGVSLVPALLREILEQGTNGRDSSLRFVLLGGGRAPSRLVSSALEAEFPVCPTYGLTETASQVATMKPGEAKENPECVGIPVRFANVALLSEEGTEMEPGEEGNIVVSGPVVTDGYYRMENRNEEKFVNEGFVTGDRGVMDESNRLWIRGRVDRQIVSGGENVDPVEVEEMLNSSDLIRDSYVFGISDKKWGQKVIAAVETVDNQKLVEDELKKEMSRELSDFKIPKEIFEVKSLPRTPSGTIDDREVRKQMDRE